MARFKPAPVKLPYSVTTLHRKQQAMLSDVKLSMCVDSRMDDKKIREIAEYIHGKFGYSVIPRSFFDLSLAAFSGRRVAKPEWERRMRRIAAFIAIRRDLLKLPIFPPAADWEYQTQDELIPVLVQNVEAQSADKTIWMLQCLALGGTPAEVRFHYKLSQKMGYRVATQSGFSRQPMYAYLGEPMQLTGLILVMKILKGSDLSRINIEDTYAHSPSMQINRDLIRSRHPAFGRECPYNMHIWCHQCGIGRDACPLATRKTTAVDRHLSSQ